jgi:hypothetical protein
MKLRSLLRFLLTSRRTSVLFGCAAVGLLGGLVTAVILFSRAEPVYESHATVYVQPHSATGPELRERERLEQEAAALRDRGLLERAAAAAGMDGSRGLSAQECGEILGRSLHVEVRKSNQWKLISDLESAEAYEDLGLEAVVLSLTGPDPQECAAVLRAMLNERTHRYHSIASVQRQNDPAYQEWVAQSRRVASLTAQVADLRNSLRHEMDAFGKAPGQLNGQELLALQPPQILKPTHDAYRTAAMQLAIEEKRMLGMKQYHRLEELFVILEAPRPNAVAAGPEWVPLAQRWAVGGTIAGLVMGVLLTIRKPRVHPFDTRLPVLADQF